MSLILCLETSAKACSIALGAEGRSIAYLEAEGEMMHSRSITLLIQQILNDNARTMADLSAVAVSQGPGSYTGLRVGASCAKGLCYASDIPLISVPTLEVIAAELVEGSFAESKIVPMIDARRMEVYYNIYDFELQPQQETTNLVLDPGAFQALRGSSLIFCGDGAHKMEEFIEGSPGWHISPSYARASAMVPLAQQKFSSGDLEDTAYYVPFYLKPPNITKSTKSFF